MREFFEVFPCILVILWFVSGLMGYFVAPKGREPLGATLGFLYGPFGVLIAVLLKSQTLPVVREEDVFRAPPTNRPPPPPPQR